MLDNSTTYLKKYLTGYVAFHSVNDITDKYSICCYISYRIIYTLD